MSDLEAVARAWMEADPDPLTRDELAGLLRSGDTQALAERFENALTFGTAGLRAPLGAGPARMNIAVVEHFSAGLARYLAASTGRVGTVVVGHDARHRSADFAAAAVKTLADWGAHALLVDAALPTPLTAFAVRHFRASAGVMVTASHNPAPDNGYKVYLSDGAQVLSPHDQSIAKAAHDGALPGAPAAPMSGYVEQVDIRALLDVYAGTVLGLMAKDGPRSLKVVYTPLHGVGGAVLPDLLVRAGFPPPTLVAEQADPDPDFPTAPFPNPEEPGVLDLAIAVARERGADIVLANDPDADRLAVAVPSPEGFGTTDDWRALTGDELGTLIGDHLLRPVSQGSTGSALAGRGTLHRSGRAGASLPLVATSVVSSTFLSKLAARAGVAYVETLTGFKWLARAHLGHPDHSLMFAYEEALGYACSEAVADKDGISAALVVAEMAAMAKSEGRSLLDRLDELECAYGVHTTSQLSGRLDGPGAQHRLGAIMAQLRREPPSVIADMRVEAVKDLLRGGPGGLPPSDILVFELEKGCRVVLRPSGTEPKLKAYLQATTAPCSPSDLPTTRIEARHLVDAMRKDVASRVKMS